MFPRGYFSKKYFTGKYWPPAGLIDYILRPIKFFYRAVVQTLFDDIIVEKTFACEGVQTEFNTNRVTTLFMSDKINTNIVADKRPTTFYDSRPARS